MNGYISHDLAGPSSALERYSGECGSQTLHCVRSSNVHLTLETPNSVLQLTEVSLAVQRTELEHRTFHSNIEFNAFDQ
jgi:hypothetical protein